MKLIDLIVKEVKREDIMTMAQFFVQDWHNDSHVAICFTRRPNNKDYPLEWRGIGYLISGVMEIGCLAEDASSVIITRDELMQAYDAADKKSTELVEPEKLVDDVNHPSHYNNGGIECIDIIAEMVSDKQGMEAACVANVVKYLYRYKNKGGIESVKKAQWYLNKMIEGMESGKL